MFPYYLQRPHLPFIEILCAYTNRYGCLTETHYKESTALFKLRLRQAHIYTFFNHALGTCTPLFDNASAIETICNSEVPGFGGMSLPQIINT